MSNTNLTSLLAKDLVARAQGAKTHAEIAPIAAELERRVKNREAKLATIAGGKGAQASASILAHGRNNLAAVQAMAASLKSAKPTVQASTFTAQPVKPRGRSAKSAGLSLLAQVAQLSPDERAMLASLLK